MDIRFLRHATLVLNLDDLTVLLDPMLSPAQSMDPIANAGNDQRIPMVDLPLSDDGLMHLLNEIDAVLVTHTHRDHWDMRAEELLRRDVPLFCQPEDQARFVQAGFSAVQPIGGEHEWRGLRIYRTYAQHGSGELGQKMAPSSGYLLAGAALPLTYIAGDSIWCPQVEQVLTQFSPQVVVLNTGAASYVTGGGPITMDADDVCQVCRIVPMAKVIAVHMEVINHCRLTRADLRARLASEGLLDQVVIPEDGAIIDVS
jgi:L-ascorbate metabolism protein UlaG (beta-lactamase superfamily)